MNASRRCAGSLVTCNVFWQNSDDPFWKNISLQLKQLPRLGPVGTVLFVRSGSSKRNSYVFIAVALFVI